MAHPLGDAFWPNNRPQTNRNSVKTLTKTGPYQTSTAEFRLNYVQLIGIGQQISFGQALIWQAWTLAGIAAASGTFPAILAHNGPFFVLKYLTKSHNA